MYNIVVAFLLGILMLWGILWLSKRTPWFLSHFRQIEHLLDLENNEAGEDCKYSIAIVGSNSAYYGFSFKKVHGLLLSTGLQFPAESLQLLRRYQGRLGKNAHIILALAPFSSFGVYNNNHYSVKYLPLIDGENLTDYQRRESLFYRFPLLVSPLKSIRGFLAWGASPFRRIHASKPLDLTRMEIDARRWISVWQQTFGLENLNVIPRTENFLRDRDQKVADYRAIITFCHERSFRPVIVLPPMTRQLYDLFPVSFLEDHVYAFIREVTQEEVPLLDYLNDSTLQDISGFRDAFFLNPVGASRFTEKLCEDLRLIDQSINIE